MQQDEGFARFIKTHSSPTHQRVTAGGRIVPMENRPPPPQFSVYDNNPTRDSPKLTGGNKTMEQYQLKTHTSQAIEPFPKFYDGQSIEEPRAQIPMSTRLDSHVASSSQLGTTSQQPAHVPVITHSSAGFQTKVTPGYNAMSQPKFPVQNTADQVQSNTAQDYSGATQHYRPAARQNYQKSSNNATIFTPSTTIVDVERHATAPANFNHNYGLGHGMPPQFNSVAAVASSYYGSAYQAQAYQPFSATGMQMAPYHGPTGPTGGADQSFAEAGMQKTPYHGPTGPTGGADQFAMVPYGYNSSDSGNNMAQQILPQTDSNEQIRLLADMQVQGNGMSVDKDVLQKSLDFAVNTFESLTRQEQMLDQYLAVERDRLDALARQAHARQRMELVEQRAEAKQTVNSLRKVLGTLTSTSAAVPESNRPATRLNVQAPAWEPKQQGDVQSGRSQGHTQGVATMQQRVAGVAGMTNLRRDPQQPNQLNRVNIPTLAKAGAERQPPVDEWGARTDPMPPGLFKRQSDLAEKLAKANSSPSSDQGVRKQFAVNEQGPSKMQSQHARVITQVSTHLSTSTMSSGDFQYSENQKRRAPPSAERDYEKMLDAMRLDPDTTTIITKSNGERQAIEGMGLRQPDLKNAKDWEKNYWLRKPDRVSSFERLKQALPEQKDKQTQDWVNKIDRPTVFSPSRAPWIMDGTNLLAAKGSSSVALQNVSALSYTRGGFDGAADKLGRKVLTPGSNINKVVSPKARREERKTADGWYSAFSLGQSIDEDFAAKIKARSYA